MKNEQANKHNLSFALIDAFLKKDIERLKIAAQAIFDAGYELEEMIVLPAIQKCIAGVLMEANWSPDLKNQLN